MLFLRRALVTLVVLGVLVAAVDVGARLITQQRVAREIQVTQKLPEAPSVGIGGFSFLTQAARGRFDDVSVTAATVPTQVGVPLSSVVAQLNGVSLPMGSLVSGRIASLPVDAVHATAYVSYASLTKAVSKSLPAEVTGVSLTRTPDGQLRVAGTYTGLGVPVKLAGNATVTLKGSTLVVSVPEKNLTQVPEAFRPTLARLLTVKVAVPALPDGLTLTTVDIEDAAVAFSVSGRNVTLQ